MMAFFGMINCYTLRVNLSMAIVAMVNGTYLHEIEKSASDNYTVSHEDVCYPPDANKTKNETTVRTGRFWATVCKTVCPMLSHRCLSCPVCL